MFHFFPPLAKTPLKCWLTGVQTTQAADKHSPTKLSIISTSLYLGAGPSETCNALLNQVVYCCDVSCTAPRASRMCSHTGIRHITNALSLLLLLLLLSFSFYVSLFTTEGLSRQIPSDNDREIFMKREPPTEKRGCESCSKVKHELHSRYTPSA